VNLTMAKRAKIWSEATLFPFTKMHDFVEKVALADVEAAAHRIVDGKTRGRVVITIA